MRLFIAVLFPDSVVDRLVSLRDSLHDEAVSGSFVPRDNLHLTLEFLGECNQGESRLASEALEALGANAFSIRMNRLGFFSRPDGDIWWVGAEESKDLLRLHSSLSSELSKRGFSLEKRKFRPHITLGRRVVTASKAGRIEPIDAPVSSVSLMLSERGEGHMVYTELSSVRLIRC